MNASASAGSHCHGYWFVKAANRRTSSSLGKIVLSFRNRARCCVDHPTSIASNRADAGSRWTTTFASARWAAPGRPANRRSLTRCI